MNPRERDQLIDALLEGDICEADFIRLEAELSVNPEARRAYYARIALTEALREEAKVPTPSAGTTAVRAMPPRRWVRAALALAAVVAVAFVGAEAWKLRRLDARPGLAAEKTEPKASGFAVIVGQAGAVWRESDPLANGALIPSGTLHLRSGVVQMELFSGVTVVVEGEAEFEIVSPMEMSVAKGKMRAHVPEPARGFRLRTRDGEIVDLGTEFAVDLSPTRSELHVIDGDVEWHPRASTMRRMEKGAALRWDAGGNVAMPANAAGFIGVTEMGEKIASARQVRLADWQAQRERLRQDARMVAYFPMASGGTTERQVPNESQAGGRVVSEGAIVAAGRAGDRWGKVGGALDFSPTGSRVRVSVPGEYRALTLLCWVKINSLDRWYNSLFLTDGHEQGEPHWQIMNDGRLFFSVKKRDVFDREKGEKDKHIYFSPPFWSTALSGQWLMIATVYDPDARRVTHYLNGEPLSTEAVPEEYLVETVRIGAASIGNWGMPSRNDPHFAVRNLNGSMDEFCLFAAALDAGEIAELYRRGRP